MAEGRGGGEIAEKHVMGASRKKAARSCFMFVRRRPMAFVSSGQLGRPAKPGTKRGPRCRRTRISRAVAGWWRRPLPCQPAERGRLVGNDEKVVKGLGRSDAVTVCCRSTWGALMPGGFHGLQQRVLA